MHSDIETSTQMQNHKYPNTIWVQDPNTLDLLMRFAHPDTQQPEFDDYLTELYWILYNFSCAHLMPKKHKVSTTRMVRYVSDACLEGKVVDELVNIVICAIARAGNLPSEFLYKKFLRRFRQPDLIRRDCLSGERQTDMTTKKVTGAKINKDKIGGSVDDCILFIGDPMGATGSSAIETITTYLERYGTPRKIILLHAFVAAEYIAALNEKFPDIDFVIVTLHVDRSGSPADVLLTTPGERLNEELGLTEEGYLRFGPADVGAEQNGTPGV